MPSKRRLNTSHNKGQPEFRYFVDRNLGSVYLPKQLREVGFDLVVHDDVYRQTERDPLIFYECGVKGLIVVTSDLLFRKSFPHMAAIALARTTVIAFSNNNCKSDVRGAALIKARPALEKAVGAHAGRYFIGIVTSSGTFRVCAESPLPLRKTCDPRDWESYERVCKTAGVPAFDPKRSPG